MSTASSVPETWELTDDDARQTLRSCGRGQLVRDAFVRLRVADGFSHARSLAYTTSLWIAVVLWAIVSGLGILFNINTGSLRQAVVPNHMLGRVISIAMVLAWSANPIGALVGGVLIERTGDVRLIYAIIGALTFLIAFVFRVASPLGHAERYLTSSAGAAAK